MPLLELKNAGLHYGTQVLLENVEFSIEKGQRICLIGRNGAGKSSLMKVIEGSVALDEGNVWRQPQLKIARLEQDLPAAEDISVYDTVAAGLSDVGKLLAEYHRLLGCADSDDALQQLARVQQQIDAVDGWSLQTQVETVISRLQLPADKTMGQLSGGWRRRVALAQALVIEPDLLLLDEPTNHLDILAIEWLEKQLLQFRGAVIFITHDRSFLQSLATDIAELDRGHLRQWRGDYHSFLAFRQQQLEEEERHNALFDKRLADEEKWIRQGIKARRTRNEGRVRALKAMRVERSQRREQQGQVKLQLNQAQQSGKLVVTMEAVSQSFTGKCLIDNFSGTVMRGDRIGLIGPNGIGKSTLLKIILGDLEPEQGKVKRGTSLEVAYFDQLRDQLELDKSAVDNVSEGRDSITIGSQSKHIISYLSDFLFTGERARTPIRSLSGGERNRVLLAKLFSKPSNLLVLDEPTNDLDVETLELLEDLLSRYEGTVLLVSHDREFLDNVVTSTIAFEGDGRVLEYVGGYADWQRQGGVWAVAENQEAKSGKLTQAVGEPPSAKPSTKKAKLSYKLQRELDALPQEIESLEQSVALLEQRMAEPGFFQQDHSQVTEVTQELANQQQLLEQKYSRWDELDNMD